MTVFSACWRFNPSCKKTKAKIVCEVKNHKEKELNYSLVEMERKENWKTYINENAGPIIDLRVEFRLAIRCWNTKLVPKILAFARLLDRDYFIGTAFVFLEQSYVLFGSAHVRLIIGLRHLASNPEVNLIDCLNDKNESGVKHFALTSRTSGSLHIQINHNQSCDDTLWVFRLMTGDQEYSRQQL